MKYKIGDKVRIKSIDWYNENKNKYGNIICGYHVFTEYMSKFCGCTMIVCNITNLGVMTMDGSTRYWTDEMIEGLVEEETKNWADTSIPDGPYTVTYDSPSMNDSMSKNNIHNEIILPEGYQFKDEDGNVINATKIILEKKRKEYPKTYEKCCKVLGYSGNYNLILTTDVDNKLFNALYRLKVCRDAYWKLYGEEMGLGKPWEPDWKNSEESRYCIVNIEGDINLPEKILTKWILKVTNKILVFPTEEMRDAFYENFKDLIKKCKDLL